MPPALGLIIIGVIVVILAYYVIPPTPPPLRNLVYAIGWICIVVGLILFIAGLFGLALR